MLGIVQAGRFTKRLLVFLSPEQDARLERIVRERKSRGETSEIDAARGDNENVNKGMLLREALEQTFPN